ncbi:MAG TPA: glycosyltransferase family 39 protein [Ktedonobacteraceae bacterium]|nr:glycosyltransferase family 39 protein [Ktedonobacteraceae bacterium]
MKIRISWRPLALYCLVLLGLGLRLYGLNWDQGTSMHPDERQILFHVTTLGWPTSIAQFLDPMNSPLNPHFFAYGSFPLYLLAGVDHILGHFFPDILSFTNATLLGRVLSALFDSGTILLTGWLGLRLMAYETSPLPAGRRNAWKLALLAAALVTFTPFQIQLSHFYAVDTTLLFFVMLTLLACVALVDTQKSIRWSLVVGLGFALALATKFSAAPLVVPIGVALLLRWHRFGIKSILEPLIVMCGMALLIFVVSMPYAVLDFHNFVQQVADQGSLARGQLDLPYVRQFYGTIPYWYETQNIVLWGLGLLLGISSLAGVVWLFWRIWKRDVGLWLIILSWLLSYFLVTGSFFVKFMRYMLPIYPCLTLVGAAFLLWLADQIASWSQTRASFPTVLRMGVTLVLPLLVLLGTVFQGLALLNVYSEPNTRITASRWIYQHIPAGSVLTYEQWDDALPLAVDDKDPVQYSQESYIVGGQPQSGLDLYGDDTLDKATHLSVALAGTQVLVMASDRLYKSIPRDTARYPMTIQYYQLLFSGQLGFHLAAQFENRPNLLGIRLDDSGADESYSVFDHPTVRIFVKDAGSPYTSQQLYQKLIQGVQFPLALHK